MSTQPLLVKDLMSPRVATIGMDDSLRDARRIFNRRRFHHLVVLEKGRPAGVVSDRDLLKHISPFIGIPLSETPRDRATLQKRIHQIMTRTLISTKPETPVSEAARQMIDRNVSCLPVIADTDKLVGIITARDLLRWVIQNQDPNSQSPDQTG